jgi:rubrerythrin
LSRKFNDEKMQEEATDLLKKQIEVERTLVRLYGKTSETLKSRAVARLLQSIQLDSIKHIGICETAIDILSGEEVAQEEKGQLKKELETHIQLEKDSMKRASNIIGIELVRENKGVERLMKDLSDDEKRHHKTLMQLIDKPFYRINPNDLGFIMLGEDQIRSRQEKGYTKGLPKKKV